MDLRPVAASDLDAFERAAEGAFHEDAHPEDAPLAAKLFEPERSLAVFDRAQIVATAGVYTRALTVPGGPVPAACVTAVGVLPTHRRRGLLTRMMRRQLEDVHARGEALAALWASEPAIYGRFGYGLAARSGELSIRTPAAVAAPVEGATTVVAPAEAVDRIAPMYDAVRRERPGHLDRAPAWWEKRIHFPEYRRDGAGTLRAAVHEAPGGAVDAYALYAVKPEWGPDGPQGQVVLREVMAADPAGTAAIWAYLLGLDLTRHVTWHIAPADEPLVHLVARPVVQRLAANLWVRPVEVGAALAARAYATPLDLVLEMADPFCPWNASRWRLAADTGGAQCDRTGDAPDLALSAADLGAAYLGGTTLAALAAAGRVRELRPGALAAATAAFRAPREPWCPEIF
jgi:predicted acetyltransferase